MYCVLFQIKNLRQAIETAKRRLTKEKLYRHVVGERTGAPLFLTMKEENEQSNRTLAFNESNIIGANFDKFTSMLGKVSTQNRQSKPIKPKGYQGRG